MWNNKKPLNEKPSGKKSMQANTSAAVPKKQSDIKAIVRNSNSDTPQVKSVSTLMGWQI